MNPTKLFQDCCVPGYTLETQALSCALWIFEAQLEIRRLLFVCEFHMHIRYLEGGLDLQRLVKCADDD